MKLPDWNDVFVIIIFGVLAFLVYSGKISTEWFKGIVMGILMFYGVKFGTIYERIKKRQA